MRENRDLTVSDKHTQSSRDSSTISISDNSATRESIPGIIPRIMTDTPSAPTTFPVETDVAEIPEEIQAQSNRSVMPTDIQALTVLQSLVSDDFQAKNTRSTQRKGEDTQDTCPDETFQLIQKIHNQLHKSNGIFKGSIRYISIRTNSTNSRQVLQSIFNSTNKN